MVLEMRRINRYRHDGLHLDASWGRRCMFTSYYNLSSGIGFETVWGNKAGAVWAVWVVSEVTLRPAVGGIRVRERLSTPRI